MSNEEKKPFDVQSALAKARSLVIDERRRGRPTNLTPDVHDGIITLIKGGMFAWVAAGRQGIPNFTFTKWMDRGKREWAEFEMRREAFEEGTIEEAPECSRYAAFWFDVVQARAYARSVAEMKVFKENPLAWLTKGPGRDRVGEPGWTERTQTELSGPGGGPIPLMPVMAQQYDLKKLPDGDLDALEDILTRSSVDAPSGEGGEGPA